MPLPVTPGWSAGLHFSEGLEGSARLLEQRFVPREKTLHSDLCSAVPDAHTLFLYLLPTRFFFVALHTSIQYSVCVCLSEWSVFLLLGREL